MANSGLNEGRLDGRTPVFSVNLLHQAWASGLLGKVIAGGSVSKEALSSPVVPVPLRQCHTLMLVPKLLGCQPQASLFCLNT